MDHDPARQRVETPAQPLAVSCQDPCVRERQGEVDEAARPAHADGRMTFRQLGAVGVVLVMALTAPRWLPPPGPVLRRTGGVLRPAAARLRVGRAGAPPRRRGQPAGSGARGHRRVAWPSRPTATTSPSSGAATSGSPSTTAPSSTESRAGRAGEWAPDGQALAILRRRPPRGRRDRHRVRRRRGLGHPGDPAARAPGPRHGVGGLGRRIAVSAVRLTRAAPAPRLSCSCSRSPGRTARTAPPCAPRPRSPSPSSIPRQRPARCWRAGHRTSRASRFWTAPGTAPPSAWSHHAAAASHRSRARSYGGRGCSGRGTATACSSSKEPPEKPAPPECSCCARTRRPAGPSPAATKPSPTRRVAPGAMAYVRSDRRELWIANRDGADAHRVAAAGEGVAAPRWLPDTRRLLFVRDGRVGCSMPPAEMEPGGPGGRSDRAPAGGLDAIRLRAPISRPTSPSSCIPSPRRAIGAESVNDWRNTLEPETVVRELRGA